MKDIAIIGVAGRFPEAKNIKEFRENLIQGQDSVRDISFQRKSNTSLAPDKEFKEIAFMEDIEKFDHKFFNISKAEAENMDPHQRIILEVVYETIESSGYSFDYFNGTETAVFIGDTDQEYYKLADKFDPTLLTGNTSATTAGRISRFFNFRGNATMLDTACSSSLLAVHMACKEIETGDADFALACGVRFILFPEEKKNTIDLGIMSGDGKTKSFSAKADGSGAGEAVGCVLLKSLDKALADNDLIYAVIKGSAVNQDAQLSGSLTAPSSQAQCEVIKKAWKKAGIDPATITYIETHGSGTKLGDPIEIAGIDQAFKGLTDKKHFCAVSSVKTNIGHTGGAAGISGLIKAILSLQHKEQYPSLHFDTPNPFIDFKNSHVYVNTEYRPWETSALPRRAGVSSFGLSGTNCHVILEEPPVRKLESAVMHENIFTFSAKTAESLKAYLSAFTLFIKENKEAALPDISYTLNTGRKQYNYRFATVAKDADELINNLQATANFDLKAKPVTKLIFLFSDDSEITPGMIDRYCREFPVFDHHFQQCKTYFSGLNDGFNRFAFQYCLYKLLQDSGLDTEHLLGIGLGDTTVAVLLDEISLEEAVNNSLTISPVSSIDLPKKMMALVERETESEKVAFIEMGTEGCLSRELKNLTVQDKDNLFTVIDLKDNDSFAGIFKELYLQLYALNWVNYYSKRNFNKIELPSYQFDRVRCWLREPLTFDHTSTESSGTISEENAGSFFSEESTFDPGLLEGIIQDNWTETEKQIGAIWVEVLKLDSLTLEDDFFRLGGHSLMATKVIARIEKSFDVKLVFKDIFTFATVRSLARGVDELVKEGSQSISGNEILPVEKKEAYNLSHAQKRLWLLHEMEGGNNIAYNLPAAIRIKGKLDKERLKTTFRRLIERHESFRTSFEEKNGQPVQKIHESVPFEIEHFDASEDEMQEVLSKFLKPFDLTKAPLLRVGINTVSEEEFILLFDMHHIISDGVSLGIITREFVGLYAGEKLEPLKIQYKEYAEWQENLFANGTMQRQEDYWLAQFSSVIPVLALPLDKPRPPVKTFEGDKVQFTIDTDQLDQLKELAKETKTTLYMVLLASYTVLLAKYSGQEDIIVGSAIAGRPHRDIEHIVGMFVNTLVMRNTPSENKSFNSFLAEVKDNSIKAYENQDYPFSVLIEKLNLKKDRSRNPLFDTLFVLQNLGNEKIDIQGLSFTPFEFKTKTAQFDLMMEVNENESDLLVNLEYNTSLFEEETIVLMSERYKSLITDILAHPTKKIKELDFKVMQGLVNEPDLDMDFNF